MIQLVARGVILAVVFCVCAGVAQAQQYAALVMDARTGEVLHSRNADTRLHPASLTKMMTLYIVFDEVRRGRLSLDQRIRISSNAAAEPPSKLGLRAGQRIELRYLIRAAALKSANDAATALGEAVAGSEEAFAERMTAYARAMGMRSTTFKNANGLTASGHLSTARDMATLGRRLMYDYPQYYNLFSRRSTSAGIMTVRNTNRRLLDAYPGADGIKTGYTRAAGFNLVASASRGNRRVLVAVFGGKSSASRNAEVARLMDLGLGRMPARASVASLPPLRVAGIHATGAGSTSAARASTVGLAQAAATGLTTSRRPLPRAVGIGGVEIARRVDSIAEAIAEVNAELAARNADAATGRVGVLRPLPRPGDEAPQAAAAGSASTFAAAPRINPEERPASMILAGEAPATTGGPEWGVELGAYRSRGDAERQLLTTALHDLPPLTGGLRRIAPTEVQGVTVYRAQFVGLSEENAIDACSRLAQMNTECLPLAPGS